MRGRFTTEELRDPSETHQKYERTVAHKHRRNNIIIDLKESIIDFQGDLFLFQPISHVIFHYQLFFFDFDWFLKNHSILLPHWSKRPIFIRKFNFEFEFSR